MEDTKYSKRIKKLRRKFLKKRKPGTDIVLGTNFDFSKNDKSKIKKIFSKITADPVEAIKDLI